MSNLRPSCENPTVGGIRTPSRNNSNHHAAPDEVKSVAQSSLDALDCAISELTGCLDNLGSRLSTVSSSTLKPHPDADDRKAYEVASRQLVERVNAQRVRVDELVAAVRAQIDALEI